MLNVMLAAAASTARRMTMGREWQTSSAEAPGGGAERSGGVEMQCNAGASVVSAGEASVSQRVSVVLSVARLCRDGGSCDGQRWLGGKLDRHWLRGERQERASSDPDAR